MGVAGVTETVTMRGRLFLANWMTHGTCSWNTILKRVIYTLYFAFCNVFLRPTCNRRCAMLCRGWCPSITLPPSNSVQISASQQLLSGTTSSTPEQTSAKAAPRAFRTLFGGDILYCRRMRDRMTGLPHNPRFLGQPRIPIVFCRHSLCDKLLICSPAQEQQEQDCFKTRAEWGVECDSCALPDASHNI